MWKILCTFSVNLKYSENTDENNSKFTKKFPFDINFQSMFVSPKLLFSVDFLTRILYAENLLVLHEVAAQFCWSHQKCLFSFPYNETYSVYGAYGVSMFAFHSTQN
jgi:hypothetical protein